MKTKLNLIFCGLFLVIKSAISPLAILNGSETLVSWLLLEMIL